MVGTLLTGVLCITTHRAGQREPSHRVVAGTAEEEDAAVSTIAPLVERELELSELGEITAELVTGHASFVMIHGPAGIGKTSLLRAVSRSAEAAGVCVLHARGAELESQFSFGLMQQLFDQMLMKTGEKERRALLSESASSAFAVLGESNVGEFAAMHSMYWLTANFSQDRPVMLIIDDLHWSDSGSLRFLSYLQPRLEGLPLAVVTATRFHEPQSDQRLLSLLNLDPACKPMTPAPLTQDGMAELLGQSLDAKPDAAFVAACEWATGGNPLLTRLLAGALASQGWAPTSVNVERIGQLNVEALGRTVANRLARLPADWVTLAHAVALLGDDVPLANAATFCGLEIDRAADTATQLARVQILEAIPRGDLSRLSFVHPMIRTAVYEHLGTSERLAGHARAVRLLDAVGEEPERIASHLLRLPPARDAHVVALLRRAADAALVRGSPDTAIVYLERCIAEPPPAGERLRLLTTLGETAYNVDNTRAARYLEQALAEAVDPAARLDLAQMLGEAVRLSLHPDTAATIWKDALAEIPDESEEWEEPRRRLQTGLASLGTLDPHRPDLQESLANLRKLPFHDSLAGRSQEGVLSLFDCFAGDSYAVDRAHLAVSDDLLILRAANDTPLVLAWMTLIIAEDPRLDDVVERAVTQAHKRGSINALTHTLTVRALSRLWRGDLEDAATDAVEAVRVSDLSGGNSTRFFIGPWFAEILMEQGRMTEAEETLGWVSAPDPLPRRGPFYSFMDAKSKLLRLQGRPEEALTFALDGERRFTPSLGDNPAFLPWRSEAALSCHALGRPDEGRRYAREEIPPARRWGAPRGLGRALRVAGMLHEGAEGLAFLREAVDVLKPSIARLEYAKALVEYGAALRRAGKRAAAKEFLAEGLDLSFRCGAHPLEKQAETELRAAGARPRRTAITGVEALTPSELRVAALACEGLTNREIAQRLFVMIKTVEVHLGSSYRKLNISRREQLARYLP